MIRSIMGLLIICLLVTFGNQSAIADSQWKEKQQALFEKINLKPGEMITTENFKKIDDLVPFSIANWIKKGLWQMKIGEFKYDISHQNEWINASKKNAGKYQLNEKKVIVEVKTKKPPLYIYGKPFPNLDIKNDPDGGAKFMFNYLLSLFRLETSRVLCAPEWIGKGGFERQLETFTIRHFFWGRPNGAIANPAKFRFKDIMNVINPYDMAGTNQLTLRRLDGTPDEVYVYIPAIRRVKRMSGANRSDPYMGCDMTVDDTWGFAGLMSSMKWTFLEEKIGLFCASEFVADHPRKMIQTSDGTWRTQKNEIPAILGEEIEGWKGAKHAFMNVVWIPRKFYLLEGIPRDPYYNMGKIVVWIENNAHWCNFRTDFDRAKEYWKQSINLPNYCIWGNKRGMQTAQGQITIDEKMNHTTYTNGHGRRHGGMDAFTEYNDPNLNPKLFTLSRLRMWSK